MAQSYFWTQRLPEPRQGMEICGDIEMQVFNRNPPISEDDSSSELDKFEELSIEEATTTEEEDGEVKEKSKEKEAKKEQSTPKKKSTAASIFGDGFAAVVGNIYKENIQEIAEEVEKKDVAAFKRACIQRFNRHNTVAC